MLATRIRRTPDQWRTIFAKQASSGLSQQAFCESASISVSTFHRWRQRLACEESPMSPAPGPTVSDFIELPNASGAPLDTGLTLRLELGAGVVLELRRTV